MAVYLPLITARLDEERNKTTTGDGDGLSDDNTLSQKMVLTLVV